MLAICSHVYAIINALMLMLRDTKQERQSGTGAKRGVGDESRLGPRDAPRRKEIHPRLARVRRATAQAIKEI